MGLVSHYFSSRDFLYKHTAGRNSGCNTGRLMANRVLIGKRGTSDYGLYVSNPGVNVLTATDDDLMFNSDLVEGFNVLQSGTVSNSAPNVQSGFSESISSWVSYSGLGLTYPPLIILSKAGAFSGGQFGFDADYFLSGEGIYEPSDVDVFQFSPTFYENDFTNKRFRVYKRRYESASEGIGGSQVYGVNSATTTNYFILAIGDVTANGGANYFTA